MRVYAILCVVAAAVLVGCSSSVAPGQPSHGDAKSLSAHHARLYVANNFNAITVYDENGNLLKTHGGFPGLIRPTNITFDAADNLLYVMNVDGAGACCNVAAYTTDGTEVANCGFHVDGDLDGRAAFDPSTQRLYVMNFTPNENPLLQGTGFLRVYNRSGSLVSTSGHFSVSGRPIGFVADPKNQRIYITTIADPVFFIPNSPPSGAIAAFDEDGDRVSLPSAAFHDVASPEGIAFDSANDELYVANAAEFDFIKPVTAFDQNGNEILTSGSFNMMFPGAVAFDPSNRLLYVASGVNGTIRAFDENGNRIAVPGDFPGLKVATSLVVVP